MPAKPAQTFRVASERNKTETVSEDFILNYGGVVVYENGFDGEGRDFGKKDATEGVGD